jgi:hypothetical protein
MNVSRETIYSGLFAAFSTIQGFNTVSRKLKHWSDVPGNEQPALFQIQKGETIQQTRGLRAKYDLDAELYLYAFSNDASVSPSSIINPLIDAVENMLRPLPGQDAQTLGIAGVSHVWIEGRIETDEGVLGDQTVAIIPIKILTT